jgi:hypothetical protein
MAEVVPERQSTRLFGLSILLTPHVVARAYPPRAGHYRVVSSLFNLRVTMEEHDLTKVVDELFKPTPLEGAALNNNTTETHQKNIAARCCKA